VRHNKDTDPERIAEVVALCTAAKRKVVFSMAEKNAPAETPVSPETSEPTTPAN